MRRSNVDWSGLRVKRHLLPCLSALWRTSPECLVALATPLMRVGVSLTHGRAAALLARRRGGGPLDQAHPGLQYPQNEPLPLQDIDVAAVAPVIADLKRLVSDFVSFMPTLKQALAELEADIK